MAKRKPLESRTALLIYNFAMVALNLYIFVEVGILSFNLTFLGTFLLILCFLFVVVGLLSRIIQNKRSDYMQSNLFTQKGN